MSTHEQISTSMHARLLALREQLCARIGRLDADKRRHWGPLSPDSEERATQRENDDVVDSIEKAARSELREVDFALERIRSGCYGVCTRCGARIEPERLAAVPFAKRCHGCLVNVAGSSNTL